MKWNGERKKVSNKKKRGGGETKKKIKKCFIDLFNIIYNYLLLFKIY